MKTYIIGGGASLTEDLINFLKLEQRKGHKLFGVNHALKYFDLDYLIYLDQEVYTIYKDEIENGKFEVFTRCNGRPKRAKLIKCVNEFVLNNDITNGVYCGKTGQLSGIGAVSIALNLGLEPIYLCGYDGGDFQGKAHHHHVKNKAITYSKKNPDYEVFRGRNITNLNPESHIDVFPKTHYSGVKSDKSILFHSYYGFGDQIHMRPFVLNALKTYKNVYVVTPYQDILYSDTKVKCIAPITKLKNQKEWAENNSNLYVKAPKKFDKTVRFDYGTKIRTSKQPILTTLNEQFPICNQSDLKDVDFSFPVKSEDKQKALERLNYKGSKKICVLKLPTLRQEWQNKSRNALMKYFQRCIDLLKGDFYIISVADLRNELEWLTEELPTGIDKLYHNAEFPLNELVGLCSVADLIITTPSNFTVLGVANNLKVFNIFGGYAPYSIYSYPIKASNNGYLEPEPFCFCFDNAHQCNKEIKDFDDNFITYVEKLYPDLDLRKKKRVILVCRMGADLSGKISKTISKKFDTVSICHTNDKDYKNSGIENSYMFSSSKESVCYQETLKLIKTHEITDCIIGQIGNTQSNGALKACQDNNVKIWCGERFFDYKIILDTKGLQYTPINNLIYAENHQSNDIIPIKKNREPQPNLINNDDIYKKYGVSRENTIVFFAQTCYDEAVKISTSPFIPTYYEFIQHLIERNKNAKILIKYHPQENIHKLHRRFEKEYSNVIVCDENIESLFSAFDYFASFSSTVIFQGLMQGKKFVTCGYHLVRDKRLVLEISRPEWLSNIISKLRSFKIDENYRQKRLSFITKKYAVDINSQELLKKLLSRETYY